MAMLNNQRVILDDLGVAPFWDTSILMVRVSPGQPGLVLSTDATTGPWDRIYINEHFMGR